MKPHTVFFSGLVSLLLAAASQAAEAPDAVLAAYVQKPDASYGWTKRQETKIGQTTVVELTLTSQTWRGVPWRHQLFVIKPSTVRAESKHALLLITGGRWRSEYAEKPTAPDLPKEAWLLAPIVEQLGTPVAILRQVPQQPMFGGLVEDQLISMTFEKYLRTGDSGWPLLAPMVKSATRAMDAVTQFAEKEWSLPIETFTVTGASKRGWTTWLTAAVDRRATAIAPMVIDMLNMGQHMRHQLAVWGKYSDRIHDYTDRGLQHVLETEGGKRLRTIVDPYSYLSKIDQPKLIILGTNDSYWPLDAANLYWNDVTGDKYLLYVPNNGHGLRDMPRVLGSLAALHESQANGTKLPKLDWKFSGGEGDHKDGAGDLNAGDGRLTNGGRPLKLVIESDVKPQRVSAWTATSATRDFRQAHWTSAEMREKDGRYEYELATPTEGHVAIFGEAVYNGRPAPYFFSTNVRVVGAKEEAGE